MSTLSPAWVLTAPYSPAAAVSTLTQRMCTLNEYHLLLQVHIKCNKYFPKDFPGDPVAKTLYSQSRGKGVRSLVKELESTCHNWEFLSYNQRSHKQQTETQHSQINNKYFSIISESSQTHNVLATGLPLTVKVTSTFLTRKWISQASWAISWSLTKKWLAAPLLWRREEGWSGFCHCRCLGTRKPFFSEYVPSRRGHLV